MRTGYASGSPKIGAARRRCTVPGHRPEIMNGPDDRAYVRNRTNVTDAQKISMGIVQMDDVDVFFTYKTENGLPAVGDGKACMIVIAGHQPVEKKHGSSGIKHLHSGF